MTAQRAPQTNPQPSPAASAGGLLRSIKMVAWSFLGIRKRSEFQDDLSRVTPFHVIGVGLVMALLFVLGLVALVNWVVKVA